MTDDESVQTNRTQILYPATALNVNEQISYTMNNTGGNTSIGYTHIANQLMG